MPTHQIPATILRQFPALGRRSRIGSKDIRRQAIADCQSLHGRTPDLLLQTGLHADLLARWARHQGKTRPRHTWVLTACHQTKIHSHHAPLLPELTPQVPTHHIRRAPSTAPPAPATRVRARHLRMRRTPTALLPVSRAIHLSVTAISLSTLEPTRRSKAGLRCNRLGPAPHRPEHIIPCPDRQYARLRIRWGSARSSGKPMATLTWWMIMRK